eukprot:Lithocolla_globosa_v1_NODE_721_length_3385_cov_11.766967.p5 type:complete len:109 gc:universal NODE_721_length_3385_cov_11.766967:1479-1153(-)
MAQQQASWSLRSAGKVFMEVNKTGIAPLLTTASLVSSLSEMFSRAQHPCSCRRISFSLAFMVRTIRSTPPFWAINFLFPSLTAMLRRAQHPAASSAGLSVPFRIASRT